MNRCLSGIFLALAMLLPLTGCQGSAGSGAIDKLRASGTIAAREVEVAAEVGGAVKEVAVEEGDRVKEGDVLFRLDDELLRAQRAQAEAGLRLAQARLDEVKAGARSEEVVGAQAALEAAKAQLAKAQQGARPEEVASGQAAVDAARAGVRTAGGGLAAAQAALQKALAGATAEDIAIAERLVEQAKNTLWGAQSQRDGICGSVGVATRQSDCDGAKAGVQSATEAVRIAELQLQQVRGGARPEDIAAAKAQVEQGQGQLSATEAQLRQAEAGLAQLKNGASAEDIAIAKAGVDRARAAYDMVTAGARAETMEAARAQLDAAQAALKLVDVQLGKTVIHAPLSGVVLTRNIEPGEIAVPSSTVIVIGRLDEVELTVYVPEDVYGQVQVSQRVEVSVDSFALERFAGSVVRIADKAEFTPRNVQTVEGRRSTVYGVKIRVLNPELKLKAGMPADVAFVR